MKYCGIFICIKSIKNCFLVFDFDGYYAERSFLLLCFGYKKGGRVVPFLLFCFHLPICRSTSSLASRASSSPAEKP